MKCKCGKAVTSKGKYCSDKCKQAAYRNRLDAPTVTPDESVTVASVTPVTVVAQTAGPPSHEDMLQDCHDNPGKYAKRAKPEILNWGAWMTTEELMKAGLIANRVSIPGDWDYEGTQEATG